MVNGIVGGLKTLIWGLVFLIVFVYALGVLLRQLMVPDHSEFNCTNAVLGSKLEIEPGTRCNRGAFEMDRVGITMFRNVPRSMLTIFMCLTDGCSSSEGTPLLWHLWDTHGTLLVIGYVLCFIFVVFGIFNLILAIFVENTLEYARSSDQRRASRRQADHLRNALKLQQLLIKVCSSNESSRSPLRTEESQTGLRRHIRRFGSKMRSSRTSEEELDESHLCLRVKQEDFEAALEQDSVQALLEDLDVSISSREALFDILDADGNGYLAVSELADGIMRLRGPADKGDIISTVLMVRCLQKHVMRFEEAVLHNQRQMKDMFYEQFGQPIGRTESKRGSQII